ncbi:translation initiation factor IF-2, mitochondrial [Ciona intestinalis]
MNCAAANILCIAKHKSLCHVSAISAMFQVPVATYKKKTRKKILDVMIQRQKRINRKVAPVIEIDKQLTINQIAKVTDKPKDYVLDALYLVNPKYEVKSHNREMLESSIVSAVITKLGYRYKYKQPNKVTNTEDKNAYPRDFSTDESKNMKQRSPVITIMGHVDHGKTTLLDKLRKTTVAAGEAGGITQRIGAFEVELENRQTLTFLDTPGHAAFSSMRQRGANLTDIVVLVVAADDGVMEQTVESINMARNANVPVIVAVNKCDVKSANPTEVLLELAEVGLQAEEVGGDIQTVEISAKTGTGLQDLIECILVQADVLELTTDRTSAVEGVIVESRLEKYLGSVASAVVQHGTLKKGDHLVAGTSYAKVKQIFDENGRVIKTATASMPVDIAGWKTLPPSGEVLLQVPTEARAKEVVEWRKKLQQEEKNLEDFEQISQHRQEVKRMYDDAKQKFGYKRYLRRKFLGEETAELIKRKSDVPELNIILKADLDGSLGAVNDLLCSYDCHDVCELQVVTEQVGEILESDIELANTLNAVIITFNVSPSKEIKELAEKSDVEILSFNVIYHLFDALVEAIEELLPPVLKNELQGDALVLDTFTTSENKSSLVAGCKVKQGNIIMKDSHVCHLIRGDEVIHEGKLLSMFHQKVPITTANIGQQCGLLFKGDGILPEKGDVIKCFKTSYIPNKLKWEPSGFC